jgi:hypothetical protein
MEAAMLGLAALACPLGMLAMMGGMAWMARRTGAEEDGAASPPASERREVTHA